MMTDFVDTNKAVDSPPVRRPSVIAKPIDLQRGKNSYQLNSYQISLPLHQCPLIK